MTTQTAAVSAVIICLRAAANEVLVCEALISDLAAARHNDGRYVYRTETLEVLRAGMESRVGMSALDIPTDWLFGSSRK